MKHQEIKQTIMKFCELMIEKEPEVQSIKVHIEMKDKINVKFKRFRSKE